MRKNKGFTLVELLVVIVIIGVIVGMSIPLIRNVSASLEKRKYTMYLDSIVSASKLYNDSYSEDLFGHNENGCAYVTYQELVDRKLLKDIQINEISCNSSSTFVRVIKIGDKYGYSGFLGCGPKKNGKADKIVTTLPVQGQENVMNPDYCTGTDENNILISADPTKGTSLDKKQRSTKLGLQSGTGIGSGPDIYTKWITEAEYNAKNYDSLAVNTKAYFTIPGKSKQEAALLKGNTISVNTTDITTPNGATEKYYLLVKVNKLNDLYGNVWTNKQSEGSKYVTFGPYIVDNKKPDVNKFEIVSTNKNYNALKVNLNFDFTDKFTEQKDLKICVSQTNNNCTPTEKYTSSKTITLSGILDGKDRTVYIAVEDLAGNITRTNKKYKVAQQYVVTLDNNGATKAGTVSTKVMLNDKQLGSVTNPQKVVKITYVNTTGATASGGDNEKKYNLNGWYTAKGDIYKVASSETTPVLQANIKNYTNASGQWTKASDSTLYAHWDSVTAQLPTVKKTGYTCHWETKYNGTTSTIPSGGTWDFTSATSRTFTAVCKATQYIVTLDGNTATQAGSTSTKVSYNAKKLSAITNPQKVVKITYKNNVGATVSGGEKQKNYGLAGWYTAASGGTKVANSAAQPELQASASGYTNGSGQWTRTSDATLYAHWNSVTITLPTVKKTGHTCHWETDNGSSTIASGGSWTFVSATSRTFTAVCEPIVYSVTLDGNTATQAGSTSATVTPKATKLSTITKPQKVVKITYVNNVSATVSGGESQKSYGLAGWYTAASGGTMVASSATTPELQASVSGYTNASKQWTKTSGATLYAHWNSVTAQLPTVKKTGYTCHWQADNGDTRASGGTWKFTSAISRTFTAVCEKNTYTLSYNDNSGSGCSSKTKTAKYNEAWGTLCTPKRSHYKFTGWYNSSGSKVTSSSKATANIKVTAHWEELKNGWEVEKNGYESCGATDYNCLRNQKWKYYVDGELLCSTTKKLHSGNTTTSTEYYYRFDSDCYMHVGWYKTTSGKYQYFRLSNMDGNTSVEGMRVENGTYKISNKLYTFNANGICTSGCSKTPSGDIYQGKVTS